MSTFYIITCYSYSSLLHYTLYTIAIHHVIPLI